MPLPRLLPKIRNNWIFYILISVLCASCLSDEPEVVDNTRNYYKGTLFDLNGDPVSGKRIRLETDFNQFIARFTTDVSGNYEGAGVVYNTNLRLSVENDGLINSSNGSTLNEGPVFTRYELNYTTAFAAQVIQLPDLIYAPVSLFNLTINNNSGNPLDIDFSYTDAYCYKVFENDIETTGSTCYELNTRTINTTQPSRRISFYVVANTDVTVTLTDGTTISTQNFSINQPVVDETINFN